MNITDKVLIDATGCTAANAGLYAAHLDEACKRYEINTPERLAAFLAQVGHESRAFRYVREIWGPTPAQARYEGRADLGNTEPGDGIRYCGRGLIQTTGRWNYRRLTMRLRSRLGALVPDFEADPEELERPRWAAISAADYWDMRAINELADAGDFTAITRQINGGLNGQADRLARWAKAKRALSVETVNTSPAPAPKPEPAKEAPVAPLIAIAGKSLLSGLAKTLISAFVPLATEKIEREIGRHTDKPEVVEQITDAVITAAKVATGLEDPIEAVAEARKDPEVLAQVEASVLEKLTSMAPLLERMAALDLADKAATEASYDAAARRAAGNPNDQDTYLTKSIVGMTIGLLVVAAVLTGALAWLKVSETILMAVFGLFNAGALLVLSKFGTRYDHRYGSSTGSAAKDVVIRNLTNGKQP